MGGQGAGKGRVGGIIHSEKLANDKKSAYTKIKFYIIFIQFFFYYDY